MLVQCYICNFHGTFISMPGSSQFCSDVDLNLLFGCAKVESGDHQVSGAASYMRAAVPETDLTKKASHNLMDLHRL